MLRLILLGSFLALTSAHAIAADRGGSYAVSGAGRLTCESYRQARDNDPERLQIFLSWMSGYFTARNEVMAKTFDILPWQSPDLMVLLVYNHCGKHTASSFATALGSVSKALAENRLTRQSEKIQAKAVAGSVMIYRAVLERVELALKEEGLFDGITDDNFGVATQVALGAYQEQNGLKVTGLPDQDTLWRLFYGEKKKPE